MSFSKKVKDDRGQTIFFMTAFLLLMVLFVGVAVDVGWMAFVKSQGQAAVDAAALAGAAGLPAYNDKKLAGDVLLRVSSLNNSNFIMNQSANITSGDVQFCSGSPTNCGATIWPADGIRVTKAIPTPLFFANLLNGGNSTTINVSAVAWLGSPGVVRPDLPVALLDCQVGYPGTCSATATLDGFNQSPNPKDDSAFTSYFTHNASAKVFKDMVNDPSLIPLVKTGEAIELNNGQVNSALKEIEEAFNDKKGTDGNWCVILPVISCKDLENGNPVQQAKVVGFAQMCITKVDTKGNPKSIQASLNCGVLVSGPGSGTNFGANATVPILVK
jgi:hypothetical protein